MIEHEMRKIPNTFGLDVEAAVFLEYSSVEELEKLIAAGRITSPYLHIGGGSQSVLGSPKHNLASYLFDSFLPD